MKRWGIIKSAFRLSLTANLTTTKLLAWAMFIFTWRTMGDIPLEGRAFYVITIFGIIAALYGIKKVADYHNKKKY